MRVPAPFLRGVGLAASFAGAALLIGAAPAGAGEDGKGSGSAERPPKLAAAAWMLVDGRSGEKLAGQATGKRLPIASTTKLMTAYLTLRDLPLDREIEAPPYSPLPAESVLGLDRGERISVRDLLVAMMLPSANDAAFALADEVSGSIPRFVKRMNGAAAKLGLDDTSYENPIGLDDPLNGSSARDLITLTRELREDRRFRKIVSKSEATLRSGSTRRKVETRNTLMLSDDTVDGVKTGHTLGAGYVLVSSAERMGVPLLAVVLGAGSEAERDTASEALLDYGFSLYSRRRTLRRGEPVGTTSLADASEPLELVAARSEQVTARADQQIEVDLEVPADLEGPIAAGEPVGRAVLRLDGERIAAVPVLAGREVAASGLLDKASKPVAGLFILGGLILVGSAFVIAIYRGRNRPVKGVAGRTPEQRLVSRRRRTERRQEGKRE